MKKNAQEEFDEKMKITLAKQADLVERMDAFMEANGEHFTYLRNRARARNIEVENLGGDTYFQDINKFLMMLGVKNIIDDEDIVEQQYAIDVFRKYQFFANELRGIRRELLEHKIEMTRHTVASFYDLIETQRKNLNSNGLDMNDRAMRNNYRYLKIDIDNFISETQADIERMEAMIKLDELKLVNLQQEKLN